METQSENKLQIDHKIIICGIAALVAIETILVISDHDTTMITSGIVGAIALAIGVVIPVPTINNKTGVLKW